MRAWKHWRVAALAVGVAAAACGDGGMRGIYTSGGEGFFEQLNFTSGEKVEITFIGTIAEGNYVVEDGKVKITVNNQTQVLLIASNGCLEGGGLLGTYCQQD
jgi:hypothetical protein